MRLPLFSILCIFGATALLACSSSDTTNINTPSSPDAGVSDAVDDGAMDEPAPTPTCDEYCAKIGSACTGAFGQAGAQAQYTSHDDCESVCNAISAGDYTDMAGTDSLGCRLNQLAPGGAGCNAAGSSGGGVCNNQDDAGDSGRCLTFCGAVLSLCTPDNGVMPAPYPDMDTCINECGTKFRFDSTKGEYTTSGDTLNCRQYYLVLAFDVSDAATAAAYQCPHLGWPATAFCQ